MPSPYLEELKKKMPRKPLPEEMNERLTKMYDTYMADAESHRELAKEKRLKGNQKGYERHMATALAFKNAAVGISEARGVLRDVREEYEDDG